MLCHKQIKVNGAITILEELSAVRHSHDGKELVSCCSVCDIHGKQQILTVMRQKKDMEQAVFITVPSITVNKNWCLSVFNES